MLAVWLSVIGYLLLVNGYWYSLSGKYHIVDTGSWLSEYQVIGYLLLGFTSSPERWAMVRRGEEIHLSELIYVNF